MTLTLSAEQTGTITIGGAAVPITLSRVGQNARYTFTGTAGQTVSLGMTSVTIPQSNVSMYKPDGSVFIAPTSISTSGGALDSQVLPVTGTYAILVDPSGTYTGNMTLRLYGTPDVTGTITINGATVTPSLTVPGQRALLVHWHRWAMGQSWPHRGHHQFQRRLIAETGWDHVGLHYNWHGWR